MWLMPNNGPADSEGIHMMMNNTTNSVPCNAITTAAVTTTTAKVDSVQAARAMHENWNNMNANWLMMNQAAASEETDHMNNTTNFAAHIGAVAATTSTAKEMNIHGDSSSSPNSNKRSFEDAIAPFESGAAAVRTRAVDHSQLSHRTSVYRGVTR